MFTQSEKFPIFTLASVMLLFAAGRLIGPSLFDNHWSFIHFQQAAAWYPWVWGMLSIGLFFSLEPLTARLALWMNSRKRIKIALAGTWLALVAFYIDSILLGGGNLRVSQLSQADAILFRWFELGSISFVAPVYKLLSIVGTPNDIASGLSWRIFAFCSIALAIVGLAKTVAILSKERRTQILLFIIGLFGAHSLLLFGFIGIESVVPPVTIWFTYFALQISFRFSYRDLAFLWMTTIGGVFMHLSIAFLLPAAIYLSSRSILKTKWSGPVSFLAALVSFAVLLHLVFRVGLDSFEFSYHVLQLDGKLPFSDYSLFSSRHLGDVLGLIFLVAPLILFGKLILLFRDRPLLHDSIFWTLWLLSLGGTIVAFISDPINSIVLDFPRLVAYLTPYSLLLIYILSGTKSVQFSSRVMSMAAAASIVIALSYLPTYRYIGTTERFLTQYADDHPSFWRQASIGLRDAYFQKRSLDKANEWDLALVIKSTDYLAFRSCTDLIVRADYSTALQALQRLIATNPYWAEPRATLATTLLRLGQNETAKPQIDSCLLLEPFTVRHHLNLYNYYRNNKKMEQAVTTMLEADVTFPGNLLVGANLMAARYLNGQHKEAEELAEWLFTADPTLPDPYMFMGLIEETRGNLEEAIVLYRKFVTMAPDDADQPIISQRLNDLTNQLRNETDN